MLLEQWNRKEFWNLAAVAWAAMLINVALVLEYGFDQQPCALCMTQRLFVVLAGLLAVAGLAHNPRLGIYPLLVIVASLVGGYFSIRHLYLLSLPPGEVASCGVDWEYMVDAYPVMQILRAMTTGTGECAEQSYAIPALALVGFAGMIGLAVGYWRSR